MRLPIIRNGALTTRGRRTIGMAGVAVLSLGLIPSAGLAVAGTPSAASAPSATKEVKPDFDIRNDASVRKVVAMRKAQLDARPSKGVRDLRRQLGVQGIVDMNGLTGTPRKIARVDGFLTGRSTRSPARIALDYVRARPDVFGLTAAEVARLTLRKTYKDIAGTTHLSFVQSIGGVTFFGNGLKAHVAKDGRLIQVDGSNLASTPSSFAPPSLTAVQARAKAVGDVYGTSKADVLRGLGDAARTTQFKNGDHAKLVLFQVLGGTRTAWQTITMKEGYLHLIDAQTGKTLYRSSLVANDNASTWDNYPGAPVGGVQESRNLTRPGWLPNNSPRLAGNVAHVWKDINDDDIAQPSEEVLPSGPRSFVYPFTPVASFACPPGFVCSWDPNTPNSWQLNANQDAVQMFYFLGKFHDHLLAPPIGFTREAGNFEAVDDDAIQGNAIDGANTAGGLPDGFHVDNANMNTPPDPTTPLDPKPRMQMYLFHQPGTTFDPNDVNNSEDPFLAGNSGDEADIVYHEYTHGLSNRLVVDANGVSTLGDFQAGSMGEAWSDWYAYDLLVDEKMFNDTTADGELRVGEYVGWGNDLIRTQPIDCSVGSTSAACHGTPGAGPGGYTYGDYGRVIGRPEVHADGEIWAETLWDLRKALGVRLTRSLVTRAMELSPNNPSFLDMRNSILQADLVVNAGKKQTKIWQIFAARGMGWFAGSVDGDDATPVEDFSMPPPASTPRGSLTGLVRDSATNAPLANVVVAFGGHNSGFAGDYATTTNASGQYTISGIIPGTYPKVFARGGAGFDANVQTVSIAARVNTLNWALRRDWAAAGGGGRVVAFNGIDFTIFGCGPPSMIDQSQGSGWSTDTVFVSGETIEERFVTVELPVAVNVTEIDINPSNICGDAGSASTSRYRLETSPDGTTWSATTGDFGIGDRNYHPVGLPAGTAGVKFVRYTMISTQVEDLGGTCNPPNGNFDGCLFIDSVELGVYGTPA